MPKEPSGSSPILVTGATGYIGGRLVPRLLERGCRVRVLARDPGRLQGREWSDAVEVVKGDVNDPASLVDALNGVSVAYYLIHSMSGDRSFRERDIAAAEGFAAASKQAAVQRIVFLGGLGDPASDLSEHLRSRHETGQALRSAGVPVTEFRAAVVVGSGSVSFEMIRYLTERLPVMICPTWVYTRVQPIAIRNLLEYLLTALDVPDSAGQIIEIGGADVLTYGEMMLGYAKARGLTRRLVPVPVLTPWLSSRWVHLVTPIPSEIAEPLIQGMRNEVIVRDDTAHRLFPAVEPIGYEAAVRLALQRLDAGEVETSWSDPLSSSATIDPVILTTQEGMLLEQRQASVDASLEATYAAFTRLGGSRGWLYWNWAWRLRGLMDRVFGGPGYRRGRRHATVLRAGDPLDFWRVEVVEPGKRIVLRAEMKLPGRGWLQFQVERLEDGTTRLTQTALFAPKGLFGTLYWWALYPAHQFIFSGMIAAVADLAESIDREGAEAPIRLLEQGQAVASSGI